MDANLAYKFFSLDSLLKRTDGQSDVIEVGYVHDVPQFGEPVDLVGIVGSLTSLDGVTDYVRGIVGCTEGKDALLAATPEAPVKMNATLDSVTGFAILTPFVEPVAPVTSDTPVEAAPDATVASPDVAAA